MSILGKYARYPLTSFFHDWNSLEHVPMNKACVDITLKTEYFKVIAIKHISSKPFIIMLCLSGIDPNLRAPRLDSWESRRMSDTLKN